jgi:hypothetical protein
MTGVIFSLVMTGINHFMDPSDGPIVARPARARDRLIARWRGRRLDRELADGTPPEQTAGLARRGRWQTALPHRRVIAVTLRRMVRDAAECRGLRRFAVQPRAVHVLAVADELSRLADALATPGPVAARGVARAWLLLTDGTGPLYSPRGRPGLRSTAASAVRALRPWPA